MAFFLAYKVALQEAAFCAIRESAKRGVDPVPIVSSCIHRSQSNFEEARQWTRNRERKTSTEQSISR